MIIIDFFKEFETSWEELREKALAAVEEFQKGAIPLENGEVDVDTQYSDYKQVLNLGLKTFIMEVINDWRASEEPILLFKEKFYQRFSILEMEGVVQVSKLPYKFDSSKELFKFLKENKITVDVDNFEKISASFEEGNIIATMISLDYKLLELDEMMGEFPNNILDDDDDDDDDTEDIF